MDRPVVSRCSGAEADRATVNSSARVAAPKIHSVREPISAISPSTKKSG